MTKRPRPCGALQPAPCRQSMAFLRDGGCKHLHPRTEADTGILALSLPHPRGWSPPGSPPSPGRTTAGSPARSPPRPAAPGRPGRRLRQRPPRRRDTFPCLPAPRRAPAAPTAPPPAARAPPAPPRTGRASPAWPRLADTPEPHSEDSTAHSKSGSCCQRGSGNSAEALVRRAGRRRRGMGTRASAAAGSQQPPARTQRPPGSRPCANSQPQAGRRASLRRSASAQEALRMRPGALLCRGGCRTFAAPGSSRQARSSCAALRGPSAAWSSSAAACHSARRAGGTAKPTLPAGPARAQAPRTCSAWSCDSAVACSARRARGTAKPSLPGMKQAQSQDSAT